MKIFNMFEIKSLGLSNSILLFVLLISNHPTNSECNRLRSIQYDTETGIDHYDARNPSEPGNALESIQSRLPADVGGSELPQVSNSIGGRLGLASGRRSAKQAPEFPVTSELVPNPNPNQMQMQNRNQNQNDASSDSNLAEQIDELEQQSKVCVTEGCVKAAADILKNMDQRVDPCSDFYRYSCGGWIDSQVIPDDKTSVSLFSVVQDELDNKLRLLIERQPAEGQKETPIVGQMRRLYESCMNTSEYWSQQ